MMRFLDRLRSDLTFLLGLGRVLRRTRPIARNPKRIFPLLVDELAERHRDRPALTSPRESLTYRELAERSRRYARWAMAEGIVKGDVVALLMTNRPEYVAIWLGITRAGGTVALLNTNLAGQVLAACIDGVTPKRVIVAADLLDAWTSTEPYRKTTPGMWLHGEPPLCPPPQAEGGKGANYPRLDAAVGGFDGAPLTDAERPDITIEDKALFIFTSGTTGLPKAANINHFRLMLAANGFAGVMNTKPDDVMYDCLPMYHTVGGVLATGAVLVSGGRVFIRERFSAREFWDDIVREGCTIFMYIGELCRYLVNSPPHPLERAHRLRLCSGNGMRPDVWTAFVERFAIPKVIEWYAATESNVSLFNIEGKPGAIGRVPWFLRSQFPSKIVRYDVERQAPVRNAQGFCEEVAAGEAGEALGRIFHDPSKPASRFEGYSNTADNEKKILRNVFEPGDTWFRTGDLMRQDADGYYYFVDRIGDTFRWKGENVSTTEIAEIMGVFSGIHEANVYGVEVPGHEGRAGMAAIVCDDGLDLATLRTYLAAQLPDYAHPLFLRIRSEIDKTATFKQRKIEMAKEGFDPAHVADALYFDDPRARAYVRLDEALYGQIASGKVRL
jgi:fatty-acyl-CoA synthase